MSNDNEELKKRVIFKTDAEIQSGSDRQSWAEGLISQLPANHDGRNSWLLNFGRKDEAVARRSVRGLRFDDLTQAAENVSTAKSKAFPL